MFKFTFLVTTLLVFLGCSNSKTISVVKRPTKAVISQHILNIPIYIKDNGYRNFSTKIFDTQSELDSFLDTVKGQSSWNKKKNFLYILKKQDIDFNKNRLLLYRFSEASGSIVIATDVPTEIGREITVKIGKKKSSGVATSNMAYYALAYSVDKDTKDVIFDDGDSNKTITIKNH